MKRRLQDEVVGDVCQGKVVKVDKGGLTLRKIMTGGMSVKTVRSEMRFEDLILCESCHKRGIAPTGSGVLVGECRFCSRRSLCIDCWSTCKLCGLETCPLCSVKDYSERDTAAVCLDCKRHHANRNSGIIRR